MAKRRTRVNQAKRLKQVLLTGKGSLPGGVNRKTRDRYQSARANAARKIKQASFYKREKTKRW